MLERLLLAGTVTCLLYFSVQVGQSSVTPTRTNQPFSYAKIDGLPIFSPQKTQSKLTVSEPLIPKDGMFKKPVFKQVM